VIRIKWKDYRNKILSSVDNEVFYTDELKALGLDAQRHGYELKAQCPFNHLHTSGKDKNPSFTVNLERGVYYCNACNSKGNIHTFYSLVHKTSKADTWHILGDALEIPRPDDEDSRPAIDPALPIKWHAALGTTTNIVKEILSDKRGLTEATLARFLIGWDGERVTVPVYDEFSELVNIRRYKWNSFEDNFKMTNYEDEVGNAYGESRLYGIEHLFDESVKRIIWCEGEWDRLVSEQAGFPTVTATSGANSFKHEWFKLLKLKEEVWICYDNDEAGRRAAAYMMDNLRGIKVKVVRWPEKFREKGDITDLLVGEKYTAQQFEELFVDISTVDDNVPVVPLAQSSNAKYAGKRIKIPVLVAGKENAPFIYPKNVVVTCADASEEAKMCQACSLLLKKSASINFTADNNTLLKMVDCPDDVQMGIVKRLCGINSKCSQANFDVKEHGNLEVIHMIPKADANFGFAARHEYVARSGYIISTNMPTNKRYTLVGYMHANPNTQRSTYVFDDAVPEKDILDELEVTPEIHDQLSAFKVKPGQTVLQKFEEIHNDLERNVTYIWDRKKVAFAVDLVFHTVLNFNFQEQFVKRGWGECLIMGDSGQAKTTIVERLMGHYRCGELLSGESAKRTGLVYNIQQSGSKGQWSLMWGAMPLNDGGLLAVDELSGMSEDDLAKMSDVRSSGIAKATGVVSAETTSRTRMIFISNPRNGRQLKAETYGVMSILKLFGKAEDVRRLDFAVGVASGEVDTAMVNKSIKDMPDVPHIYNSDLCRLRVMWAWSRRPNNINFSQEAIDAILVAAGTMGKKYSSRVPLVEPADQRLKIARLAIATAACVYSTDDGTSVMVEKEHVEFVVTYLNEIYDSKALGYDRLSTDDFENSDTTDGAMMRLRKAFISIPFNTRELMEVVRAMYQMPYFSRNTLEDATGLDRDELKALLHFLISNSVVEKAGQDYKRTPMGLAFIEHLLLQPPSDAEINEVRRQKFSNSEV